MAVPADYDNVEGYLEDVVRFLGIYRWIYCFPNTHILVNRVLDSFPSEWLPFLQKLSNKELNDLSHGHVTETAPSSLKDFVNKSHRLKCLFERHTPDEDLISSKNPGLSKKKQHELISLAPLIHEIYEKHGCDSVVDAGTGLGYLPRFLYEKYQYRTLAIEGNPEKISLAKVQQLKHPESATSVTYLEHFVNSESGVQLQEAMNRLSITKACLTGLHACADLGATVLELFVGLPSVKTLVIMPCCYHRMKQRGNGFEKFPLSGVLKAAAEKYDTERFLNVPFLRLACQGVGSRTSEDERQRHYNNCFFRAILQDVANSENYEVRRLKRKSGKVKQPSPDVDPFEAYLNNLKHTHTLIGGEINDRRFLKKMREKWTQHKGNTYLVEALAAFQAAIQSICESVVLLDRVMFLKEKGVECFVVKVTDQGISPRCHALVAAKP